MRSYEESNIEPHLLKKYIKVYHAINTSDLVGIKKMRERMNREASSHKHRKRLIKLLFALSLLYCHQGISPTSFIPLPTPASLLHLLNSRMPPFFPTF